MATANQALARAAREIGYYRYDDPETGTRYGRWYAQKTGSAGFASNGVPFCAMFASYILDQVGQACPGLPAAYCPYILRDCQNAGIVLGDKTQAQPGDLVLFDWDGGVVDHIGFIEVNRGSSLQTIEGNTNGGRVARRSRAWSSVRAVVRVPYGQGVSAQPAAPAQSAGIAVDGWWGPDTIRALQRTMGTTVDGVISGQPPVNRTYVPRAGDGWEWSTREGGSTVIRALQRKIGADADGYFGPNSVKSLQRYLGVAVDGYCGPDTVTAFQRRLNAGGL